MDERTRQIIATRQSLEDLKILEANARRLGKFDQPMQEAIAQRARELKPAAVKNRKPRSMIHDTSEDDRGFSSNPPWSRNELILALNLYLKLRGQSIGKGNADVVELSDLLRETGKKQDREGIGTFRNENGVRMKLMNFRRFDPQIAAEGKTGLTAGNKLEGEIWNEFANDPEKLKAAAQEVRLLT